MTRTCIACWVPSTRDGYAREVRKEDKDKISGLTTLIIKNASVSLDQLKPDLRTTHTPQYNTTTVSKMITSYILIVSNVIISAMK